MGEKEKKHAYTSVQLYFIFQFSFLLFVLVFLRLSFSFRAFRQEFSAGIYGPRFSKSQRSDSFSCAATASSHLPSEKEPSRDEGTA